MKLIESVPFVGELLKNCVDSNSDALKRKPSSIAAGSNANPHTLLLLVVFSLWLDHLNPSTDSGWSPCSPVWSSSDDGHITVHHFETTSENRVVFDFTIITGTLFVKPGELC
eukprot:Protomagalhaensia_wolfi_Nauph_80__776@NODE_1449_length_1525_cov_40_869448_g1120_i0_p3_GENE_NODE_1449_length_1525_cov_40_869448_g1120_i0NODE_1449_length_1525_cov_40_869448_g1120_i0_p3_ORF_typecomplete_len112_score13_25_NODE_1449_length_1525_cov_40_869448_g1120_i09791314